MTELAQIIVRRLPREEGVLYITRHD